MRQIRETLRLHLQAGLSYNEVGRALMATSNSPTCGHSNSPRQDGGIMGFGAVFDTAVLDSFINGCLASEARQAVGIGRGAVGKPRTPQGPSTGLSCGRVACPRRARVA